MFFVNCGIILEEKGDVTIMIYYDVSEQSTKLPQNVIDYGKPFPELEQITGADFVIVPELSNYEKAIELQSANKSFVQIGKELKLSLSNVASLVNKNIETVLHEWLFAGAILVQRKSGYDFVNSIGPRLNHALGKMNEVAYKQYQRLVLVTGIFDENNELLILDGKQTNWQYWQYKMAESGVSCKGGCIELLPRDDLILRWIKLKENQLLRYKHNKTKWVVPTVYYPPDLPDMDDVLQLPIPVRDCRLAIINIPGWGIGKVNILYEYVKSTLNLQRNPNLLEMLHYATSWETANHLKGVGKGLIKNARSYVGLQDGEYLGVSKSNMSVQK